MKILIVMLAIASQYSPGVMNEVVWNRQNKPVARTLPEEPPKTDGYIAVFDCNDIGQVWWARNPTNGVWENFLVADCARPDGTDGTRAWMLEKGIAFEVDYKTAVRWQAVSRLIQVEWAKESPYGKVWLEP